jgi:transposase InsO family protein
VKEAYPVSILCSVLGVSRSGFYKWCHKVREIRNKTSNKLSLLVRQVHRESGGTYGTRRMAKALHAHGIACGRCRARTLMRLAGVSVRYKRRFRITTDSDHNLPVAPNLLNRKFDVSSPNRFWVGDITYVWTSEGWLYLATVMDLFSRQIVGWSLQDRMTSNLVSDALLMAICRRKPSPGLIFHSDRGSQYCSLQFQDLLKVHRIISSMSRKGDCWDNAVMESFFGSLKSERINLKNYRTRETARQDIVAWIEMFYNAKRRHSYLGYVSPREFEKMQTLSLAA